MTALMALVWLSALPGNLALVPVAGGFHHPLDLTAPAGDKERLFVCEQGGKIWILKNGVRLKKPFLDLGGRSTPWGNQDSSEQGLLGLAFHPNYSKNRRFFVHYTDLKGDTVLAEYRASDNNPDLTDSKSARVLLQVDQPYANHNGGQIAFGPDGYLFMALGDGGAGGDPHNNAQNSGVLLGKLLRLDVDQGEPYGIPSDNPFSQRGGSKPEIWDLGLRNPWRFSFDSATGDLWIGDVGQNRVEEVDFEPYSNRGGKNYGWRVAEANECYQADSCDRTGFAEPVFYYDHDHGACSVTGGKVYRGSKIPSLQGTYLCGDFCAAKIWALKPRPEGGVEATEVTSVLNPGQKAVENISSFGTDGSGEVYVADYGRGQILRFEALKP